MSVTTLISGNSYTVLNGSLSVQEALEQFTVCQFTIYDSSGSNFFQYGQPVLIIDSVQGVLFGGFVFSANRLPMHPNVDTMTQIVCMDQHYLVAKRAYSGKEFSNQYAGPIVTHFLQNILSQEGITAGYAQRYDSSQSDFVEGTLANVTSTNNVDDGDLELSLAGSTVTKTDSTTSNWNAGTLTNTVGSNNQLVLTSHTAAKFTSFCNGYSNNNNNFIYSKFWDGNYVIVSGDTLTYSMWISSTSPAITASVGGQCSDGTNLNSLHDNNQFFSNPNSDLSGFANDQWYVRTIDLTSLAGKHLVNLTFAFAGNPKGTYTAYFHDVKIKNGGSTNLSAFTSSLQSDGYVTYQAGYATTLTKTSIVTAYDASGTRVSGSTSIAGVGILKSGFVSWEATLPNTSTLTISTSLDGGVTWQQQTSFSTLLGILAGADATGMILLTQQALAINGPDPTQSPSVSSLAVSVFPSYVASKTDVTYTKSTTSDWNAGTHTNTAAANNQLTLNGAWRNWTNNDLTNMSTYGSSTPALGTNAHHATLSSGNGDCRARLDFASTYAKLDMSVDFQVPGENADSNCGLEWGTTNWGNSLNSYAYNAYVSQNVIGFSHGNNSSGGGAYTSIVQNNWGIPLTAGDWHTLRVVWDGSTHTTNVYMDGTLFITNTDNTYTAAGNVGLRYFNNSGGRFAGNFDNFSVVKTYASTSWLSPNYSLNSVGTCGNSIIEWQASVPALSSLLVETTIDGGSTYQTCTNGAVIPGLVDGVNLASKNLKVRFTFTEGIGQETIVSGLTCWVMSHYASTGNRISPALPLSAVGRVGNSLVAWNANLPTGTTLGVDVRTSAENSYGITSGLNPGLAYPVTGRLSQTIVNWAKADGHDNFRFQLDIQAMWRNAADTTGLTGGWDFAPLDDAIYKLTQAGFVITFPIRGMPTWALTNVTYQATDVPWFMPDPAYVLIACQVIAARYNGIYNIPTYGPMKIDKLEVGNEEYNIKFTSSTTVVVLAQAVNSGTNYSSVNISASAIAVPNGVWMQFGASGGSGDTVQLTSAIHVGDTTVSISAVGGGTYTAAHNASNGSNFTVVYRGLRTAAYAIYDGHLGVLNSASPTPQPARDPWFLQQVLNTVGPVMAANFPTVRLGAGAIWWMWDDNFTDFIAGLGSSLQYVEYINAHYYSNANDPHTGSGHVPSITTAINNMVAGATTAGYPNIPIEITEFGWQVPTDVNEAGQATNYTNFLADVLATGKVRRIYVFTYDSKTVGFSESSLYQWNGTSYHQMSALAVLKSFMVANPQLISGAYGSWTDVTSSPGNGGQFYGYTMQPDPTIDVFTTDTSANYTSTSYGGGANATWTWDTTNRRVTGTGGTRAVLTSTAPSFLDGSVIADMDWAAGSPGIAVRWQDTGHLYFLKVNDASSGTSPNTISLWLKNGSGSPTQVGATGTIVFPRNTFHRILLDVQGSVFTVSFDGAVVISTSDATIATAGLAGLLDGAKVQCYQLRIQPYGDDLTGKSAYTRLRLGSTDPTVTPQILDLTVAAYSPNIGTGALIPNTAYSVKESASQNQLSQSIDDLAKQSNYWWRVKNLQLYFQKRTGTPAPFPIATVNNNTVIAGQNVNDFLVNGFQILNSSPMYRNKEWAVGGTDQKTDTKTFQGDGITQTWALTYPIATSTTPAPNPPVITVNGVVQNVGIQGTNTGMDFYYQVGSNAITQDSGEVPLNKTQTLKVVYPAQITAISSNADATEQAAYAAIEGASGIVEVIESFPGLTKSATDAIALARNTQYKVRGRTFQFGTLHPGLAVGQIVPVFAPEHNLQNDQLLVSKVTTTMQNISTGPIPWYVVEVLEGPIVGDWSRLVSNGSKK